MENKRVGFVDNDSKQEMISSFNLFVDDINRQIKSIRDELNQNLSHGGYISEKITIIKHLSTNFNRYIEEYIIQDNDSDSDSN